MLWEEEKGKVIPLSACEISENLDIQVDSLQITYVDSRLDAWKRLFAHNLFPVLDAFHHVTSLPSFILWENIAVRINSYFRKALAQYPQHHQKIVELAEELNSLDGSCFSAVNHPMRTYLTNLHSLGEHKVRQICCHFHKLEKKEKLTHCLACPP